MYDIWVPTQKLNLKLVIKFLVWKHHFFLDCPFFKIFKINVEEELGIDEGESMKEKKMGASSVGALLSMETKFVQESQCH